MAGAQWAEGRQPLAISEKATGRPLQVCRWDGPAGEARFPGLPRCCSNPLNDPDEQRYLLLSKYRNFMRSER